jgi:hypothetical protein
MEDEIKADNYNYTKNITPEHVNRFEKQLSSFRNVSEPQYIILIDSKSDVWREIKRNVIFAYDFFDDQFDSIKIAYDGDKSFQLFLYGEKVLSKNSLSKIISEKFKSNSDVSIKIQPSSKQIQILEVNKDTGLVSTLIEKSKLNEFKKKDCTIDVIYKKKLKKDFEWAADRFASAVRAQMLNWKDRVEKIKEDRIKRQDRIKNREDQEKTIHKPKTELHNKKVEPEDDKEMSKSKISKQIKDYFSYNQDQVEDVYQGVDKPFKDTDRDNDNFSRQVRKVMKKKSSGQPLVSNPPYRGNMLEYIEDNLDEEIKNYKSKKQNKLGSILDEVIFHLESLGRNSND